jgi:hypothetical protein
MKKLRLRLDALEVDSFEVPGRTEAARGTIHGRTGDLRCTTDCPTAQITCTEDTYDVTCAGASCDIYHLCQDTVYPQC